MLIWFLAANLALAVLYVVVKVIRREKGAMIMVFFIFLPGLGFVFYFLPQLLLAIFTKVEVDREAILTHAFEIDRMPEHPDVQDALNIVPVEDAMAVSEKTEKRSLLLNQLKKDLKENYKILQAAEQDEDSESAHYVAAAKMEIYRLHLSRWLECRRDFEEDPDDPEKYHMVCEILMEMLDSGVFSAREQNAYRQRLCGLVQNQIDAEEGVVSAREYEVYLKNLVELGRYEDAESLWLHHKDRMRSETAYQSMLKMFYQTGERQKFENTLNDLRENRQVHLSAKGLEQMRYWMNRLTGASMDDLLRIYSLGNAQD